MSVSNKGGCHQAGGWSEEGSGRGYISANPGPRTRRDHQEVFSSSEKEVRPLVSDARQTANG
eukprot:scaffold114180_cov29-Tisochrysis_lutea.AAC.1